MASHNLTQVALGRGQSDECAENVSQLAPYLRGRCGLMFSTLTVEEVQSIFRDFKHVSYARAGQVAPCTVELPHGPLHLETGDAAPHTLVEQLKEQGLPVQLDRGVVELLQDFVVCREGTELTPKAASLLRLLRNPITEFRLHLAASYSKEGGVFKVIDKTRIPTPAQSNAPNDEEASEEFSNGDDEEAADGDEDEQTAAQMLPLQPAFDVDGTTRDMMLPTGQQ